MKKIKKLIITGFVTMMMLTLYSPTDAVASGPLESYADCAKVCINKYESWTLRRTLCAADCFMKLIGDATRTVLPT
jgi:hypothetical protein